MAAAILSIGTYSPNNTLQQGECADLFLNNPSEEIAQAFKQACEASGIQQRHLCVTQEELKAVLSSKLNSRQDLALIRVPNLALPACERAISAWGGSKSSITHLIFATSSGVFAPSLDIHLQKLLHLRSNLHRVMLYQQHGYAGVAALRVAKDIAENNAGARVLVVCSEVMAYSVETWCGLDCTQFDLATSVNLGDGAAAVIVGAEPIFPDERALVEIHHAVERTILPGEHLIQASLDEKGMHYDCNNNNDEVCSMLCDNMPGILEELIQGRVPNEAELTNNKMFWIVHPGSLKFLHELETRLGLVNTKLNPSKEVLASHGNMLSASILFVLERMMYHVEEDGAVEWGIVAGYGPGLTIDALLVKKANNELR